MCISGLGWNQTWVLQNLEWLLGVIATTSKHIHSIQTLSVPKFKESHYPQDGTQYFQDGSQCCPILLHHV